MKIKKKKRKGYLAPAGTFSEEAVLARGKSALRLPFYSFKELIDAVITGKVHEIVIPDENLLLSDIGKNFDLIITADGDIKVSGEIILPVRQNLIAAKKISLHNVKKVVSIREATEQCHNWLEENLPGVKKEYVESTATAIDNIEQFGDGAVAIGSILGAKTYGKKVIKRNIQDKRNNKTHFYVIAKHDVSKPTGKDKTSLIFKVENRFGALADILNVFKVLKINLTKIISRSTQKKLGDYIFWIDIEGHREDARVREALKVVEEDSKFLKVLGSYPKAV